MLKRTRKFVLWLLLACLPLQSIAGVAKLPCCDEHDVPALQSTPAPPCDHDAADPPQQDSQNGAHGCTAMDCSHHYFSAVPAALQAGSVYHGAVYAQGRPDSFQSFFPERPKRPPLAVA